MRSLKSRRDPAPSRIRYRLQRLWLTPSFRSFLKVGPIVALIGIILHWGVTDPKVSNFVTSQIGDARATFAGREEFKLSAISIRGAGPELSFDVRQAADIPLPISSLDVDLEAVKERVLALAAVREAHVKVIKGGVLDIAVTERLPSVLWRTENGLKLIDHEGVVLGEVFRRVDRTDLPLIAGVGADAHVAQALALFRVARPLEERLRGLVRVGERRWDLVLDRSQRVMLPEDNPVQVLQRVIGLNDADKILKRDVARVDMRNPNRPILRLGETATAQIIRMRLLENGDEVAE